MKKSLLSAALAAGLMLSGCSVMHFKNGTTEPGSRPVEKWHHNVAYSLYEISKPVDLSTLCKETPWSMITTKETFVTGLAGSADSFIYVDLWDPQMVEYTCSK